MRFFRILGIIITILVVVYITLGFFGPTEYRVERSIKIDAPINVVFNQTTKFENWAAWSPWAAADPGAKYTFEKDEQVVGAKNSWEGEVSGTGNITSSSTPNSGLTGLTAVSTEKGSFENEMKQELFYLKNWSFGLDIKIFFQTILVVIRGGNY
mgnify:CR=1 FL=1